MRRLAFAALAALSLCTGARAASGLERVATRAWVLRQIQGIGGGGRTLNVSVASNENATVSYSSPWTCAEITNAVAIRLTFAPSRIVMRQRTATVAPRRFSVFSLIFPSALADGATSGADNALRIVLKSGEWIDNVGNSHPFNLGADGLELTLDDPMPEIPKSKHECDFPPMDCTCNGSRYTEADLESMCPEDYRDWTTTEYAQLVGDVAKWIDEDDWEDQTIGRSGTTYWIMDSDGVRVSLNAIVEKSDAWIAALAEGLVTLNRRMRDCREAYKASLRCDKENPQHQTGTTKCGTRCGRCTRWISGPDHRGWKSRGDRYHSCDCGELVGEHGGAWTREIAPNKYQAVYVKACATCGHRETHLHEHSWERCQPCPGDETIGACGTPCAGCGGRHSFTAADSCYCQCGDGNCDEVPQDISMHKAWAACSEDVENDNDDGTANGAHCQCMCLKYGHNAGTSHKYAGGCTTRPLTDAESARFDKNAKHMTVFGECARCGQHTSKARPHAFPAAPEYESVSETVCRKKWECSECHHVKKDDANGHVRDPSGGCRCKNCKTYQFNHEWQDDECGNPRCRHCDTTKPDATPRHSGFDAGPVVGTGCHICSCGEIVEGHVWGATVEFEKDGEQWCKQQCVGDGWGGSGCGLWIEWKSDHQHKWTNCQTCSCGMACKTCGGKHRFEGRRCHACTCDGCAATPDDISLHTDWQPCSEDVEADNDDGGASGSHCRCACLKFGHNAGTSHAYGDFEYFQQFDEERHWKRKPACSRCHKPYGVKMAHDFDGARPEYAYESESVCRKKTRCNDCEYQKSEDAAHVPTAMPTAYEFVSEKVCRWWYDCRNCGRQKATHEDHAHGNKSAGVCECYCGHAVNHTGQSQAIPCYCQCGRIHLRISPNACGFCNYCKTTADGADISVESRHSASNEATACGCACGYFGKDGNVAKSDALHIFKGEEVNGAEQCTCQCANRHVFRDFSTGFKNGHGGNPMCAVCAYCGAKRLDGTAATEDDHVEAKNKCGCKCGALDHNAGADRFHPRKPGTCRCYGASGKGGSHHFVQTRADCPGICLYSTGEDHHRVATKDHEKSVVPATPADHRGKASGACGCRCGKYTEANKSEWEAADGLHAQDTAKCGCHCGHTHVEHRSHDMTKCKCDCGETVVEHRKVSGKCRCECGETVVTHEPVAGKCKCECGATVIQHVEGSANACTCECGATETHKYPSGEGCQACFCGKETRHIRGSGCYCECGQRVVEHIAVAGHCYCVCGGRLFGHVQRGASCKCQCGSVTSHRHASSSASTCQTCYCGADTEHHPSLTSCTCCCGRTFVAHRFRDGTCACYCGEAKSHKYATDACRCYCGDIHKPDYRKSGCPKVCDMCGMLVSDPTKKAGYLDHTPKPDGCGCACGDYSGGAYDAERHPDYHGGSGTPSCLCTCGATHRNFTAAACPLVCSVCKKNRARTKSGAEIHSWDSASCTCNCGQYTDHRYASDACYCYCHTRFRGHDQKKTSDTVTGTTTCPTCGNTIEKHTAHYVCNRCGYAEDADYESGHAWNCGTGSNDEPHGQHCNGCGCDNCSCTACQNLSGTCSSCGNSCGAEKPTEGGGESGGDGGLDDI